ncbi:hypothetical protein [Vibrio lentus]|uniref:hypothetical protein n=1 Tax=Vibrio lentus TaxID=136468 RepID=UPI00178CCF70|nr:hypothetical protein [Vibrio lentus]MDN3629867.1 hypothetical protein [Vibrio lentus]
MAPTLKPNQATSYFSILYSLFSILYSLFSILYSLFSILYSLASTLIHLASFATPTLNLLLDLSFIPSLDPTPNL